MHKPNMKNNNETGKFKTYDLTTAAYLRTEGVIVEVEVDPKQKRRGRFVYDAAEQDKVDKFFKDDGKFLSFSMNMRSLKSEISSKRGA